MTGVVHHEQLVGFVGNRFEQAGHFTIGQQGVVSTFVSQQCLDAAAGCCIVRARAVARVMNKHAVAVLYAAIKRLEGCTNVVARCLLILQIGDVAGGHLHGLGHLGSALFVYTGTGQLCNAGVTVTADANDERVAVAARCDAACTQSKCGIPSRLAAAVHTGRSRAARLQIEGIGSCPAAHT